MHEKRHHSGFTIIELMITLVVASILLGIAAPSFRDIIKDGRLTAQINTLGASLNLARSEAVKRSTIVSVCRSNDGTSCSGNWKDGWIVFQDIDGKGDVDAGDDEIIRVSPALTSGNTLSYPSSFITYSSTGFGNVSGAGTFVLCDDRTSPEKYAKALVMSPIGRVRVAIDTNSNGIVEGGSGDVSCP